MTPMKCTGKDGVERAFTYTYEAPSMIGEKHTFFGASDPLPASGNRFEMGLEDLDDDNVRITMAKHHDEEVYASKGIPEALIPIVAQALQKNVQSSPGTGDKTDIYRLKRATDYWKRTKGAVYDKTVDIYTFAKPAPQSAAATAPAAMAPVAAEASSEATDNNKGQS